MIIFELENNKAMKTNTLRESDILYLQGDINYTLIYYKSGKKELTSRTLLRYQESLDDFIRISRKHLVNPQYTVGLERGENSMFIKVANNNKLKISRRKVKYVTSKLRTIL